MNRLNGKVAVITGANSGIGKRTAELFAEEGADLVLVARRMEKLREVQQYCEGLGRKAVSVSADVSLYPDCRRVCQAAADVFGRIDILVNNAGVAYTTAKAAVIGMSKNAAIQFAGRGIRVNVVAPGPTPTSFNTPEQLATFDREFAEICGRHFDDTVPETTADDQARTILFFASDDSRGCNGQVIVVDNGRTI